MIARPYILQVSVDGETMTTGDIRLLESLIQEHLKLHDGDVERSMAAVGASIDSALHAEFSQRLGAQYTTSLRPSSNTTEVSRE